MAGAAPSEASRARFQQRYGAVRTYADYNQMLEQENLDIVSVATHAPLHADATDAAANAGAKGILVTKPMAISLAECDRMLDVCRQHGTKLMHWTRPPLDGTLPLRAQTDCRWRRG